MLKMNRYFRLFFCRIAKDLKQKELLPLKLLFFMHSSTILVLYPYLTIHMRELGINVEETAIMSAVTPAVAILMPPLAGMVADKIGNFRVLLSAFSIIGGGSALLLLLVPVGRLTFTFPKELVFGLSCNTEPVLTLYQEFPCIPIDRDQIVDIELQQQTCGVACQASFTKNQSQSLLKTRNYEIQIAEMETNDVLTYTFKPNVSNEAILDTNVSQRSQKVLENIKPYSAVIRKLTKTTYFFPAKDLYLFSCEQSNCTVGKITERSHINSRIRSGISQKYIEKKDFENIQLYKLHYVDSNSDLICSHDSSDEIISVNVAVDSEGVNTTLNLEQCSRRCLFTGPRKRLCQNLKTTVELDTSLTFWSYLCVRVFVGIISGTSFAMFEGAVIALLREHKADYGLQRIYATIGGMISSPISGWMIDYASKGKSYTDFRPIFFLYAALKFISGILMLFINLKFKKAAVSVITDVLTVLRKVEMIALLLSCIVLGCAWGFIESFLFWLLDDLGASKSLMGLTVTVGGFVGIPLLVLSGPIVKRAGHANVIFIGFIFYAIRLLGYSLLYNPWLCLVFEAMESITFGLSFTAAVTYAARLSTVTTDTTIQGVLGGLYYGVGKGIGSLVGGYLIHPIGIRHTFQLFAGTTLVIGIVYFCFYHLYMKQHPSQGTDITKKDVKQSPETEEKTIEPITYEDAMCNPAYETTEVEDDIVEENSSADD
ncbi:unnamed protein product [Acanthoscelides obtectus]|uniref:Major facilitator superfamily (MFS) profile domain-containing protein n=1 Tax=Acanthoscelides obtectus TaxID=200917 RepID=A0A9P0K1S1_ACAOB|nr:unnamed protein product [Acanthoscelides obtectus]CAK1628768.1 Major facilitator superfamily domain-containing protein 6 [Acanthoscelides obtectus]